MILVVTGHRLPDPRLLDRLHARGAAGRVRAVSSAYLNLFVFFMLMLVLGDNFVVMFVGWEGVGLCSYLLIGYYYEKTSASDAGKKAFIVNRIGDWGFILGMFLIFSIFGTLDFRAVADAAGTMPVEACGLRHALAHHAAAVHRRDRQVGADSALRLAARRDGRPDAGLCPDPRGHHGDRGRVHGGPQRGALQSRADDDADRGGGRRGDGVHGGDDRPRAERHQAGAGVLHRVAARLHVPGHGRGRLRGRSVPPDDARLLQGAPVPLLRLGDPRDGRRAGHAPHGRPQEVPARHLHDHADRDAGDRRHPAALGILQQGRDSLQDVPRATR